MIAEDRPTLPESYARAIESSRLEVLADERCSVDMLIAAGWINETLGTMLFRLRAEFDMVRSAQRQSARNVHAAELHTGRLAAAQAKATTAEDKAMWTALHEQAAKDAKNAALTERALIMVHLKSLPGTVEALHRFGSMWATKQKFMRDDRAVSAIVGKALDAWLDPICPACDGRGFTGGMGIPMVICQPCGGSRLRHVHLGKRPDDDTGHQFGKSVLTEMDRMTDRVTGQMRRFLATRN